MARPAAAGGVRQMDDAPWVKHGLQGWQPQWHGVVPAPPTWSAGASRW